MALKFNLPDSLVSEYAKYNELYLKGTTRLSSGNISYTSTSSGTTYTVSDNTGEIGLFGLLKTALNDYLINASDFNNKADAVDLNGINTSLSSKINDLQILYWMGAI